MVFIDSLSTKVVYHQIVKTEKDIYYKKALNRLREKGYVIQSITCDGRRGLLKALFHTPTQMCQFHLVAIVIRALRKKHQSHAGRELKSIIKAILRIYFYLWEIFRITYWKTTNRIEGLFKELKDKLLPNSGLTRRHKILFIRDLLNKKVGKDYKI